MINTLSSTTKLWLPIAVVVHILFDTESRHTSIITLGVMGNSTAPTR